MRHIPKMSCVPSTLITWLLLAYIFAITGLSSVGPIKSYADPAFISTGITPNLLIVIDNSESMLDLAYTPDNGGCHDDPEADPAESTRYEQTRQYAGYFGTDSWYAYTPAGVRFEAISKPTACSAANGPAYTYPRDNPEDLCLQLNNGSIDIKARGNFLNWVSASRFDIQKQVLTGGKFNYQDHTLTSEGRGCPGTRFIRQARVWRVDTGAAHILPLGIRTVSSHDTTTAIELFRPQLTGFNDTACRAVFDNMPLPDNSLDSLYYLLENCMENNQLPFELPRAADPTGRMPLTGNLYNLPALLTDIQADKQLGPPLQVMKGVIHDPRHASKPPRGLLHEVAGKLRMGLMNFNDDGSHSECSLWDAASQDDLLLDMAMNDCSAAGKDGGGVVIEIADSSPDHISRMVSRINAMQADTWSPLAETVFNAIGYYTQRPDMRINISDFSTATAPCTDWCQPNNILVITDGASTVDLHPTLTTFAAVEGQNDGTADPMSGCPGLYGGTFLDDITAYGFSGSNIHLEDPFDAKEHFQNITTYFVVTGKASSQGTGECAPATLLAEAAANGGSGAPYYADDPQDFRADLKSVFDTIRSGTAASPAASFFSHSRKGGGAIYQAHFWPSVDGPPGSDGVTPIHRVDWIGDVTALLVDTHGRLFEDTDGNKGLNAADQQVNLYRDVHTGETRTCNQALASDGTCKSVSRSLDQTNYLWSAAAWLAAIPEADINTNRFHFISDISQRYIFTWNDLDNDGAVSDDEVLPFVPLRDWTNTYFSIAADRAPIPLDFAVAGTDEVNDIISWVRGLDNPADDSLRPREVTVPSNFSISGDPATITWRLGDIIHSTPTVVAEPSENYHLLYDDDEYAAFAEANIHRRQVIYFGGNDGMVHAVNGGFYDEANKKFWRSYNQAAGIFSDTGPDLGAELWAYIPYNLLPHLRSLTQTGYQHTYYVDLAPRVFDVQIFDSSPDSLGHTDGWGTILVVGMRLGGNRVAARDIIADVSPTAYADERIFTSAYMVFDISDPENPPRLLGETTYDPSTSVNLAYTVAMPSVVPIKTTADGSDWFLILGSGPTDPTGFSSQNARIGVFPLKELDAGQAFRIPVSTAISHASAGSFDLATSPNGFVSGTAIVDYDLNALYKTDAIYFGTIEGTWGAWNGRMYRWVTTGDYPQSWNNPAIMINTGRPVTAAPSIGFDGTYYWVYFGTGRFFDLKDKSDPGSNAQEYFFGLKEPVDADTGAFTWEEIANTPSTTKPPAGNNAGSRTLLQVDRIGVEAAAHGSAARLNCKDGSNCLPSGVTTFQDLRDHIVGTCDADNGCTGTDGWVLAFEAPRERNLGQGTLLGGVLNFTTYQPFEDICQTEGEAFLYSLYYQTGTAFHKAVFTTQAGGGTETGGGGSTVITTRLALGRGLATVPNLYVGRQEGSTALVQTSTGTIVEIPQPNLPIKTTRSGRLNWRSE
ncbi:MAG: hypothetical protein JRI93_08375 [Deltaproteobacteria bacterium]|nr:hypothetical protein [Deltaproteobacteria bacterium]